MRRIRPILALLALPFLTSCHTLRGSHFRSDVLPIPSAQPPMLNVYIVASDQLEPMAVETYLMGVVAGEMPNHWPIEALKAQAILARTFVLKFITEKDSKYPGADISTDIAEAQAYDATAINERIRQAVQETAGLILLTEDNSLPYTWFHSHSGGMTETARAGIDWQGDEPSYIKVTDGRDSVDAPDHVKAWTLTISKDNFIAACRETGANISSCDEIKISQKGKSGRAVTFSVDGTTVNAARLRISLGSTRMRSTLLTDIRIDKDTITLSGRGYGHGVGMPQWGAYALAKVGKSGDEIALHYYNGLKLVRAW